MKCVCRCFKDNPFVVGLKVIVGGINWKTERQVIEVRVEGIDSELAAYNLEKSVQLLDDMASNLQDLSKVTQRLEAYFQEVQASRLRQAKETRQRYQSELTGRFMTTPSYNKQLILNSHHVEGTCQWLSNDNKFRRWLGGTGADVLLLSAYPGCGKSVLASHLIQTVLPSERPGATICYYFFKDNTEERQLSNAYSAMLHCLFQANGKLADQYKTDIEHLGPDAKEHDSLLWNIFSKAAQNDEAGPIICVLDALDEASEDALTSLGNDLTSFFADVGTQSKQDANVKFLLTTRGYPSIIDRLLRLSIPCVHLSGESEEVSAAIQQEIDLVVTHRLDALVESKRLTGALKARIRERLVKHGSGQRTYLWVKLVFQVLWDAYPDNNHTWVSLVDDLPSTVSKAYARLLEKVPERDQTSVRALLHLILVAYRPLTLREINIAINVRRHPGSNSLDDLNLVGDTGFRDWIMNTCGLFVAEYGGKVYFIHQTARDFLLGQPAADSYYRTDLMYAHRTMAESCISYMSLKMFRKGSLRKALDEFARAVVADLQTWPVDLWEAISSHPFSDYVLSCWTTHFRHGQDLRDGAECLDIHDDFLPHYLKLIEDFKTTGHPGILVTARAQNFAAATNDVAADSKYVSGGVEFKDCLLAALGELESPVKPNLDLFACSNEVADLAALLRTVRGATSLKTNLAGVGLSNNMVALAALWGHVRIFRDHVDAMRISVISDDDTNLGLLFCATAGRSAPCLAHLLAHGISPDHKTGRGLTPLHWASRSCSIDVVAWLMDHGADVNAVDVIGETPLSTVLRCLQSTDNVESTARLLVSGRGGVKADLSRVDRYGQTVLHLAAGRDWNHLEHRDASTRPKPYSKEAEGGGFIGFLVDNGAEVDAMDRQGLTPLINACGGENVNNVKHFLESGADPNKADSVGTSPLFHAIKGLGFMLFGTSKTGWSSRYRIAICLALLEHGANANATNPADYNRPALVLACGKSLYEPRIIAALLQHGADPNVPVTSNGPLLAQQATELARSQVHAEVLLQLVSGGMDASSVVVPERSQTLLHAACDAIDTYLARKLINCGAVVDKRDADGRTPMHLLSLRLSSPNTYYRDSVTGMDFNKDEWSSELDRPWVEKLVRLLLRKGASIENRDKRGHTPLDLLNNDSLQCKWLKEDIPELVNNRVDSLREEAILAASQRH